MVPGLLGFFFCAFFTFCQLFFFWVEIFTNSENLGADAGVLMRILAGCTTGAMAVSFAQPTDVVKVRFQAQMNLDGVARRYSGTMQAYRHIFRNEGLRGLWKGVWRL